MRRALPDAQVPPAGGGHHLLPLDRDRLPFRGGDGFDEEVPSLPFIAAVAIRSADLKAIRRVLARAGAPTRADREGVLRVPALPEFGTTFFFTAAGADPPWVAPHGEAPR